jgi:hypothetical protein
MGEAGNVESTLDQRHYAEVMQDCLTRSIHFNRLPPNFSVG